MYGNISPAASGEDYHRIVRRKLSGLMSALEAADPDGRRLAYVDNSPFSEKHVAIRAGLGRLMRNGLFYSRKFGSRCYIGLILSDRSADFYGLPSRRDDEDPWFERCRTCSACQKFCPGKAITEAGMNSYRCVSYLTQKKEPLSPEEERIMGRQIYGCDVCQSVCPLNRLAVPAGYTTGTEVSLEELLTMSNKQFKLRYQGDCRWMAWEKAASKKCGDCKAKYNGEMTMATWNSRGLRGSELEEIVNLTNEKYGKRNWQLFKKIPTPIKPISD